MLYSFFYAMQPLDLRLTFHYEIARLTLLQLAQMQQFSYYDFYYFLSLCWTFVMLTQMQHSLGDFLNNSYFFIYLWDVGLILLFFSEFPHTFMIFYVLQHV
jgi:hypothetical protein